MKKLWKIYDLSLVYILIAIFFSGVTVSYNFYLAIIELFIVLLYAVLKFLYHKRKREKLLHKINLISYELQFDKGEAFKNLTVACCAIEADGSIIWLNESFKNTFNVDESTKFSNIKSFTEKEDLELLKKGCGYKLHVKSVMA